MRSSKVENLDNGQVESSSAAAGTLKTAVTTQHNEAASLIEHRKFPRTEVEWPGQLETGGQVLACTVPVGVVGVRLVRRRHLGVVLVAACAQYRGRDVDRRRRVAVGQRQRIGNIARQRRRAIDEAGGNLRAERNLLQHAGNESHRTGRLACLGKIARAAGRQDLSTAETAELAAAVSGFPGSPSRRGGIGGANRVGRRRASAAASSLFWPAALSPSDGDALFFWPASF